MSGGSFLRELSVSLLILVMLMGLFTTVSAQIEIYYDDDSAESGALSSTMDSFAVCFSNPSPKPVRLLEARFYILNPDFVTELWSSVYLQASESDPPDNLLTFVSWYTVEGWNQVDFSGDNLIFAPGECFAISLTQPDFPLGVNLLGIDIDDPPFSHSWFYNHMISGWEAVIVNRFMIRALVEPIDTFTVDDLGDVDDGFSYIPGDGTNTLRKCIRLANEITEPDTINFDVSGTISPASALPALTDDGTVIDASSQWSGVWPDGQPGVTLDGSGAGPADGLEINGANNCQISGLFIRDFNDCGVLITNGAQFNTIGGTAEGERNVISGNHLDGVCLSNSGTDSNIISGNFIGTDVTGTADLGNQWFGIRISGGAQSNVVGGTTEGERNVISRNDVDGVYLSDSGTDSNIISGNFIGTDVTGTADLGNTLSGVYIEAGAQSNVVGGTTEGERNVISGNDVHGVRIADSSTDGNIVSGNYIGTDVTGILPLGNTEHGVYIFNGAQSNTVGGTTEGERNIISGNAGEGVRIEGASTSGNMVLGNYIGTDKDGVADLGNTNSGLYLGGAQSNTVGGTTEGERNIISGNDVHGVRIEGVNANNNSVIGNYIGTDKNGTADLGNTRDGVLITLGAHSNTVGGAIEGEGNVISGNDENGVRLYAAGTDNNVVSGNYIGTDKNGTADLGNTWSGVHIEGGAQSNTIGGTIAGERNIISKNDLYGVRIDGSGTDSNVVSGNYIGTDVTGTANLGNTESGVIVYDGAQINIIGGTTEGERNVISGNNQDGVYIKDSDTNGNVVSGNYIGTDVTGTADLGNIWNGVYILGSAESNTIGGANEDAGNVIAFNGGRGVWLRVIGTIAISHNSMHDNGGGIYCYSSSPTITNNVITANEASIGGGIHCTWSSSPTIANNTIVENLATSNGGGIACYEGASAALINNTITGNEAVKGGGIFCSWAGTAIATNTILWNNSPQEIYFDELFVANSVTISYSDVQGGEAGIVTNGNGTVNWLDGNINADPRFADAGSDDYHIENNSPCIGGGTTGPDVPANDIEGTPRGTPPDIGAYENILDAPVPWTIYVATTGNDTTGDGTSGNPYLTIQHGIDEAFGGCTVQVGDGTYAGAGNVNLDFGGKAITVTSENGAASCIIDCESVPETRGFSFHSGEGLDSVLDGFAIQHGSSEYGGGIYCDNSSPTIVNNIIRDGYGEIGGGIYCNSCSPTITNNTIQDNHSDGGGGIACWNNSSPIIADNTIARNSVVVNGGGIYCSNSSPMIVNNVIAANDAMFLPSLGGGGICCEGDSSPKIVNNTIAGNFTIMFGGGIFCSDPSTIVTNTILWGNSSDQIGGNPIVTYSDIEGGWPGVGNIDVDPLFADAASDDYHLSDHSPCIGAGTITPDVPVTDIEGNPRPNPPASSPDMGAYENVLDAPVPWTIHVATTGDDTTGDGTSGNPYLTIQHGIDEAFGSCTVQVGDGIYTGAGNVNLDFGGRAITVTSENGAASCIIDCEGVFGTRGFYFHSGEGTDSVVDGFTIRNGNGFISGGGICCHSSSPTVQNNIITGNQTDATGLSGSMPGGGGIYCADSSPMILNNTITGNECIEGTGGGICCGDSSPTIANNTITGNVSGWSIGGGIYCGNSTVILGPHPEFHATIVNTILWNNTPQEIYFSLLNESSTVDVSYSDVQGGEAGIAINGPGTVDWLDGNIEADPRFADASSDDYHIEDSSPCIGAGTTGPGVPVNDIEGTPRGTPPDMGAYENVLDAPVPWTIHVATTGDDTTGDGTSGNPYLTIQHGIDEAFDGCTVLVADGTYTGAGNVNLDFGGRAITVTSENGAASCIIDCENVPDTRGFNFQSGEGADSILDGFTIRNGNANSGGGIYCMSPGACPSPPVVTAPTIRNNIITGNEATYSGGGIACSCSGPTITGNTITDNSANQGGGMSHIFSSAVMSNNIVSGNSANLSGGGIFLQEYSSTIANNVITGNTADRGGGISSSWCIAKIINNTVAGNSASNAGGFYVGDLSHLTITNMILWNTGPQEMGFAGNGMSTVTISYSNIRGGLENIAPGVDILEWLTGNIDADPLFMDAASDDYRLSNFSPCLGAGTMTPDVPDTDMEGNPRPNPPGSDPDMGGYENGLDALLAVTLTSTYSQWESGVLTIEAETGDPHGLIVSVLFQYSLDGVIWHDVGTDSSSPYSVDWDTTPVIPTADDSVWVGAIATDIDGSTSQDVIDESFGVDNEQPETTDDYDGEWHDRNFTITLTGDDGDSGLASTNYKINDGVVTSVSLDGNPRIATEGRENRLEYWSIDNAGNEEEHHILTNIRLDKTSPVTIDDYDGEWHSEDFVITLTGEDELSGIEDINYRINGGGGMSVSDDGHPMIDAEGNNNELEYWSVDEAGNEEEHHTLSGIKLDKTPPVTIDDYDGEWHNVDLVIALAGTDELSGLADISYIVNDGAEMSILVNGNPGISTEGSDNKLEYWGMDEAGNTEEHHVLSDIKLDQTPPTTSDDYDGSWHNDNFVITLSGDDESSGLGSINYRINDGPEKSVSTDGHPAVDSEGDNNKLEYWGIDNTGNEEEHHVVSGIKLDKTPPTTGDDYDGEWHDKSFTINLTGDDELSGIASISYRLNGGTEKTGDPRIDSEGDDNRLEYWGTDNAGNEEKHHIVSGIKLDESPPDTDDNYDGEWHNRDFTIVLSGDDEFSGLENINYRINDGARESVSEDGQPEIDTEGEDNRLEYWGVDELGNEEKHNILSHIKLDKTPPITSDDYHGEWHNEDFTIILTGNDEESGMKSVNYRINNGALSSIAIEGYPVIDKSSGNNELEYWGVDHAGNVEEHHILDNIKLDKVKPDFTRWRYPAELTQVYQSGFRVEVDVADTGGSGLSDVLFDYHIGDDTGYDGYEAMMDEGDGIWSFEINADWLDHPDEILYYKAKAYDAAGNVNTSSELIMTIQRKPPPLVTIASAYRQWERGVLTVEAEANDVDGSIVEVLFQYSLDGEIWHDIGTDTTAPYSVEWDTVSAIPTVHDGVLLQAVAIDNDGLPGQDMIDTEFGVDNELPKTSDDYVDEWHRESYSINLTGDDGSGSGLSDIRYRTNNGDEKSVSEDGQPRIDAEGDNNQLEYWGVDNAGNEEEHHILDNIKLDKTEPTLSGWQSPEELTQLYEGVFHVEVDVADTGGSGLSDVLFDYHIGDDTSYDGYEAMMDEGDGTWAFEITADWFDHPDEVLYYKAQVSDVAGNVNASSEFSMLIQRKSLPLVDITSTYRQWENGILAVEVEASDVDGSIVEVLFQYSLDGSTWHDIGMDTAAPYSVEWDTSSVIPTVHDGVLLKAVATDNDGLTGQDVIDTEFGVDNELPETSDDYVDEWHKESYPITLTGEDASGSGLSDVKYRMDDGEERFVSLNGQPTVDTEDHSIKLEYWGVDNAGNEEEHHVLSDIKPVDAAPPIGSLVINDDAEYTNTRVVTLALSASDDGCGMDDGARMRFSSDNVTFTVAELYKSVKMWPLPEGDGRSMVYARFSDAIGNWTSVEISDTIFLDTTPPVGSVVINNDYEYCRTTEVLLSISAVDSVSGMDEMMFSNDNVTFNPPETYADTKEWELDSVEGSKTVYVKLKDTSGNWSTSDISDTITLYQPSLDIVDAVETAGEDSPIVSFSANFFDPLHTHTAVIDWGDGSNPDSVGHVTSPFTASHEYPGDDNLYTVKLTVTDDGGDSMEDSFVVAIGNVPPVVDAGEDQTVSEGESVSINAAFTDGGLADTHTAVIDWGDGAVTESAVSGTVIGSHTYSNDGIYTVNVTVTDDDGGIGTDTAIITVSNSDPLVSTVADQTVSEDNPGMEISISFTDSGTLDTHTAIIDWGDGSNPDSMGHVTSPFTASHEYSGDDNLYTVKLTVTDDGGDSMEDSFVVTVGNVPPVVDAGEDQTVSEGETISINAAFTDGGLADTHTAVIDWGDGAVTESAVSGTVTGSHTYPNDGIYTVNVTVTDDDGGIGSDHLIVSVIPPPDIASISPGTGNYEGGTGITITGENFQTGATVRIGGNPAHDANIVSEREITATTPDGPPGPADVVVINPDGQIVRRTGGFTYIGPVARLSISSPESVVQKGETCQFSVSGEDELGNACQVEIADLDWSVDDNSVGGIENGLFTAKGFGKTTVSAAMKEDASVSAEAEIEVPDTDPPVVLSKQLFPDSGDQNVPVTSNIQIEFSEPINVDKAEMKVTGENGREVEGNCEFDDEARTLTFIPTEPFKNEEAVTIIVTAVEDLSGNGLGQSIQKSFTAGLGVWPGDTNNDGYVNARDIIPIGRYWHKTGDRRVDTTSEWRVNPVAPWQQGTEATYADANGDGVVDEQDVLPIVDFWRQSRPLNQSTAPRLVTEESLTVEPGMLSIYQAMYDVLEALPSETEGVRILKITLEEIMADIKQDLMPGESRLLQNYPNPINPETWIPYQLAEETSVFIKIYDINGRLIRALEIGQKTAGYYLSKQEAAYWDGRNQLGEQVCSGVYFYHIRAGSFQDMGKLIIAR